MTVSLVSKDNLVQVKSPLLSRGLTFIEFPSPVEMNYEYRSSHGLWFFHILFTTYVGSFKSVSTIPLNDGRYIKVRDETNVGTDPKKDYQI